jgi:hypothetical protein
VQRQAGAVLGGASDPGVDKHGPSSDRALARGEPEVHHRLPRHAADLVQLVPPGRVGEHVGDVRVAADAVLGRLVHPGGVPGRHVGDLALHGRDLAGGAAELVPRRAGQRLHRRVAELDGDRVLVRLLERRATRELLGGASKVLRVARAAQRPHADVAGQVDTDVGGTAGDEGEVRDVVERVERAQAALGGGVSGAAGASPLQLRRPGVEARDALRGADDGGVGVALAEAVEAVLHARRGTCGRAKRLRFRDERHLRLAAGGLADGLEVAQRTGGGSGPDARPDRAFL